MHTPGWHRSVAAVTLWCALLSCSGCFRVHVDNPAYPASDTEIEVDWERMSDHHVPLGRPVVVLGGYHALNSFPDRVENKLISVTSGDDDDFLVVSYPWTSNLGVAADMVIQQVDERWPSGDSQETIEVDVVGVSMGGIVAREAALAQPLRGGPRKRLKIRRLYTLASPHQGATAAKYFAFDQAARDMKPGSAYLEQLNAKLDESRYELVSYAQLRDSTVGALRAAPPGQQPIWASGTFGWSHYTTPGNIRLLADIARRLRGEEPWASADGEPPRN